jgi:hypothetical protein
VTTVFAAQPGRLVGPDRQYTGWNLVALTVLRSKEIAEAKRQVREPQRTFEGGEG